MKFLLILVLYSSSLLAMPFHFVPKFDKLFVSQDIYVWCWAAMSSALTQYYHTTPQSQTSIALNNPNDPTFEKYSMYFTHPARLGRDTPYDYVLDDVLSKDGYRAKMDHFNLDKTLNLLKTNNPVLAAAGGHVVVIFGYFKIGEDIFYTYFDPYGFMRDQEVVVVNQNHFHPFLNPNSVMIYLEKENISLAKN